LLAKKKDRHYLVEGKVLKWSRKEECAPSARGRGSLETGFPKKMKEKLSDLASGKKKKERAA